MEDTLGTRHGTKWDDLRSMTQEQLASLVLSWQATASRYASEASYWRERAEALSRL